MIEERRESEFQLNYISFKGISGRTLVTWLEGMLNRIRKTDDDIPLKSVLKFSESFLFDSASSITLKLKEVSTKQMEPFLKFPRFRPRIAKYTPAKQMIIYP